MLQDIRKIFRRSHRFFGVLGLADRIEHVLGDVQDLRALRSCFESVRPDMVFHLAAQSLVRPSYDDPVDTFRTNVMGTVNLLDCVRRATHVVQAAVIIATDKCYENLEQGEPFVESSRFGGKDPYSASKACAEIAFAAYQSAFFGTTGPRVASARAGNVVGGGDWAVDRIVPDCIRAWSIGKPVMIRSPEAIRPWQHVLEPLSGYLCLGMALLKDSAAGQSFNFGPGAESTRTVADVLSGLQRHWPDAAWSVDPHATGSKKESKVLTLDCGKARTELGWQPRLTFDESLALTAQWYRSYAETASSAARMTRQQIDTYQSSLQFPLLEG